MRNKNDQNDTGTLLYNIAIIATFYLLPHIILDSFFGGVALFYPFSTHSYPLVFDFFYQRGGRIGSLIGVGINEPTGYPEGITSLGVGILLTFIIGTLFSYRHKERQIVENNLLRDHK